MDLSKLTYSKSELRRGVCEPTPKHPMRSKECDEGLKGLKMLPTYSKPDGMLSTGLVFVLSGGEKREKDFLRELIRQREPHSLRVAFMSEKGQGLQPYQMQEKWKEIQSAGVFMIDSRIYHLDAADKVFLLSDVDEFHRQLVGIFKDNSDNQQGEWIVSNPCFEIWLYYCYLNDPLNDLGCLVPESASIRSKKLKTVGGTLVPGGMNPCLAFERMTTGIENSKAHYQVDENGIPVLFATRMYEMAQYLVDTMNNSANEYSEYVRRKEEWRKAISGRGK